MMLAILFGFLIGVSVGIIINRAGSHSQRRPPKMLPVGRLVIVWSPTNTARKA